MDSERIKYHFFPKYKNIVREQNVKKFLYYG